MPVQPNQRFTFVNFTTPYEAKKENTKKLVRSNAAFSSWNKRLDRDVKSENNVIFRAEEVEQPALNYDSSNSPSSAVSPKSQVYETTRAWHVDSPPKSELELTYGGRPVHDDAWVPQPFETSLSSLETTQRSQHPQQFQSQSSPLQSSPLQSSSSRSSSLISSSDRPPNNVDANEHIMQHEHESATAATNWNDDNVSMIGSVCTSVIEVNIADRVPPPVETTLSLERIVSGKPDPFNSYPVPAEPWYDWVLHHMLTVFAPRGWPALGVTLPQGKSYERSISQYVLAEPALFYVSLLFASGDLISLGMLRPEVSLWLRTKAVQAINQALDDPNRAISEAMIMAVGRIAIHESMYGDRVAANTIHRPAQYKMIMMRGGMQALSFPDLTKRLMRWADTIMALQSETPRYLTEEAEQDWTMSQCVDVLEQWVPLEAMTLRHKIQKNNWEPSG